MQARVAVGAASPVELNQARNTLAGLHLAVEHAEHELLVCHQSLAAILGENRPSFGAVHADLQTLPALPEFEDLAAKATKNRAFPEPHHASSAPLTFIIPDSPAGFTHSHGRFRAV